MHPDSFFYSIIVCLKFRWDGYWYNKDCGAIVRFLFSMLHFHVRVSRVHDRIHSGVVSSDPKSKTKSIEFPVVSQVVIYFALIAYQRGGGVVRGTRRGGIVFPCMS